MGQRHHTETMGSYRNGARWLCSCGAKGKASTFETAWEQAQKHEEKHKPNSR